MIAVANFKNLLAQTLNLEVVRFANFNQAVRLGLGFVQFRGTMIKPIKCRLQLERFATRLNVPTNKHYAGNNK